MEEALGHKEGMANSYSNLGIVYQTLGEVEKALEMNSKALAIDEALGIKEGMAITYGNLGTVYQTRVTWTKRKRCTYAPSNYLRP